MVAEVIALLTALGGGGCLAAIIVAVAHRRAEREEMTRAMIAKHRSVFEEMVNWRSLTESLDVPERPLWDREPPPEIDSWAAVGLEGTDALIGRIDRELAREAHEQYLRTIEDQTRVPHPDNREVLEYDVPQTGIRVHTYGEVRSA